MVQAPRHNAQDVARDHRHEGASEGLAADVRATVAAAERVAESIKEEAEERARARLRQADREAERIIAGARHRADVLVDERRRRIAELSDAVMRDGETILERVGSATAAKSELDEAVAGLGEAARLLARAVEAETEESSGAGDGDAAARRDPLVRELATHGRRRVAGGGMRASEILGLNERPNDPQAPTAEAGPQSQTLAEEARQPSAAEEAPRPPTAGEAPQPFAAEEAAQPQAAPDDPLSSARLLALHMAVTGTSRAETRDELRRALGVAEPDAIVDEVFEAYEARR